MCLLRSVKGEPLTYVTRRACSISLAVDCLVVQLVHLRVQQVYVAGGRGTAGVPCSLSHSFGLSPGQNQQRYKIMPEIMDPDAGRIDPGLLGAPLDRLPHPAGLDRFDLLSGAFVMPGEEG